MILDAIDDVQWVTGALLTESQMESLLVLSGYSQIIAEYGEVETQVREGISGALAQKLLNENWLNCGDKTDFSEFIARFNAAAIAVGYEVGS